MKLFDNLFGGKNAGAITRDSEQAVIVHFIYGAEELEPLHRLENDLIKVIDQAGVGEYDGHEIAIDSSDGFLYMYGSNAENLFKAVKPTLERADIIRNAVARLRFGPPEEGVSEIEVSIEDK